MVVDDEEDVCAVMKWGLQREGFDADAFSAPFTALQYFSPHKYDLVLIDVKMPGMDGFEFYSRIKDIQHDVKVCFMTAGLDSSEEFITKHLPGNNKRVCVARKPIRIEELILLISSQIESRNVDTAHVDRFGFTDTP